jgi:hypothetical protein
MTTYIFKLFIQSRNDFHKLDGGNDKNCFDATFYKLKYELILLKS